MRKRVIAVFEQDTPNTRLYEHRAGAEIDDETGRLASGFILRVWIPRNSLQKPYPEEITVQVEY